MEQLITSNAFKDPTRLIIGASVCLVTELCPTRRPNSSPVGEHFPSAIFAILEDLIGIYCPEVSMAAIILSPF
jgi:hypothetical protein